MNIAMRLTFDGLVRALRLDAQRFADAAEFGLPDDGGPDDMPARRGRKMGREIMREGLDDRRRD